MKQVESTYFRVGMMLTHLEESQEMIAYSLLQATWQARSVEQYSFYAGKALDAYMKLLTKPERDPKDWTSQELIAGEMERRLGLFDLATERFTRLQSLAPFKEGLFADIVDFQQKTIAAKDTRSHKLPQRGK
jgi:hypothetical protein